MKTFSEWYERQTWLHDKNPCDVDCRNPIAKGVQKLIAASYAAATKGTGGCECCIGARILFGCLASAAIGYLLAKI